MSAKGIGRQPARVNKQGSGSKKTLGKLTDKEAKEELLQWPRRTTNPWPAPDGKGFWLRGQPKERKAAGPVLSSPGAKLFKTQPDGLWIYFGGKESCDLVVVEVCGSIQNLNDKRSRYFPSGHSLILRCPKKWLLEPISLQGDGSQPRWQAAKTLSTEPTDNLILPVRYLRVLFALPKKHYHAWCSQHTPAGHEFFCPQSSLGTYRSPDMLAFLGQMSMRSHFRVHPRPTLDD